MHLFKIKWIWSIFSGFYPEFVLHGRGYEKVLITLIIILVKTAFITNKITIVFLLNVVRANWAQIHG